MADLPFISIRKYIKWGDAEAGENTDTLVLTSRNKHFVDIRMYLPTSSSEPALPYAEQLPISRLEWGFAGTSTSTPAQFSNDQPPKLVKPAHSEWTHWIDNKTTEEVRDEGDMYPQPNGDVLELGAMVNPASGKVERYEEVWVDLDPQVVVGEKNFVSWVLRTEDASKGVRGYMIRIGQWMQGVVRKGDDVSVGRYKWEDGQGWRPIVSIGSVSLARYVHIGMIEENETVRGDDGLEWVCAESFRWS